MNMLAQKMRKLAADLIAVADAMQESQSTEKIGSVLFNRANKTLTKGKKTYQLKKAPARVLTALLDHRGVCVTKDELTIMLFGAPALQIISRTVDTHVCTLRKYLDKDAIKTINGTGYMLCE